MAYQGDDDYLRFGLEYGGTPAGVQLSVTSEDSRSCCATGYAQAAGPVSQTLASARPAGITNATRTVWLRMQKTGARYRMWYSLDGATFTPVYETGAPLTDVDVGLFAFNRASAAALPVDFDYVRVDGQAATTGVPSGATEAPGTVGGSVPPTLSLTLGAPATFGAFTPGVAKDYTASMTANVVSTAGEATLSVAPSPAYLTNGAFSLGAPLQVAFSKSAWTAPVSNDAVNIGFTQHIDAAEPLRTGAYGRR